MHKPGAVDYLAPVLGGHCCAQQRQNQHRERPWPHGFGGLIRRGDGSWLVGFYGSLGYGLEEAPLLLGFQNGD